MIVEEADILLGSSLPKPSPTQQPVRFSTRTPQAKQPTGQEHSPSADSLPKAFLNPPPPLDTLLDMVLPTRAN